MALAAITYVLAAWSVAPGFYDGFGPPQPYRWTCPPPQAGANIKPGSGHLEMKIVNGQSDANTVFTNDAQIVAGFLPGSFDATGKTTISIDVKPLDTCPQPSGIKFVTNVYDLTANATLLKTANVTLLYSNLQPDPTTIYFADDPNGTWTAINTEQTAQTFTITGHATKLGYFAAGYPAAARPSDSITVGGNLLPIIVAVLIVVVVLAGLPLAVMRRGGSKPGRRG
ncbi:MAG TPA: hypothetical protein VHO95_06280 [Candidatus Dormibacteraeota bacterium]|nr:hypothetical protein [Candidatus Dormibacteraeota bacterium]